MACGNVLTHRELGWQRHCVIGTMALKLTCQGVVIELAGQAATSIERVVTASLLPLAERW